VTGFPVEHCAAFRAVIALVLLAGLVPTGTALGQRSGVKVRHERPEIHRIEFEPSAPPPGMPKLTPPESGVCNTTFELETGVSYSAETLTPTQVRITVVELELTTRVTFDIYTLKDAPQKLRDHEEAHRKIGEYYYRDSAAVAGEIGRALIGESFDGEGADEDAAQKNAIDQVLSSIEKDYMARTRDRSAAANVRFDLITNHGLEPIEESVAIKRAVDTDPEPDSPRRRR
jgi:hypothetical protein